MELKFKENDFQSFEPIPYLDEYFNYPANSYGGVGVENEQFLQFFAQAAHDHDLNNSLLLDLVQSHHLFDHQFGTELPRNTHERLPATKFSAG